MALSLQNLIDESNNLADDFLSVDEVKGFVNDAMSAINIEVNTNFPVLIDLEDTPVFPEKWQRMLLIPFIKGRIKEKDSSQFEWEAGYEQFFTNLAEFKTKYIIPEEYKDLLSSGSITEKSIIDYKPANWGGW